MSLVDREDMTTLYSAADSRQNAETAEDAVQLKAVAYAINSAANTGLFRVVFQEPLRPAVEEELTSNGYSIKYIGVADLESNILIEW